MSLKVHIDSRVSKCCGAVVQSSGGTSRSTCAASRKPRESKHRKPSHEFTCKRQQLWSKCDKFQRAVQPPSCLDWCLFQRWNHDRGRTPNTSSTHKQSVKLFQTKLVARSIQCSSPKRAPRGLGLLNPFL